MPVVLEMIENDSYDMPSSSIVIHKPIQSMLYRWEKG